VRVPPPPGAVCVRGRRFAATSHNRSVDDSRRLSHRTTFYVSGRRRFCPSDVFSTRCDLAASRPGQGFRHLLSSHRRHSVTMMQMLSAAPVANFYHHDAPVGRYGRDHVVLQSAPVRRQLSSTMQQPAINAHRAIGVDHQKNYRNSSASHTASTSNGGPVPAAEIADRVYGQPPHGQLIHHQAAPTRNNSATEHLAPTAAADSVSVGPSARRISAQQSREERYHIFF
jgi:hypothetical protein